jgi:PAS domain S-box-containing protein
MEPINKLLSEKITHLSSTNLWVKTLIKDPHSHSMESLIEKEGGTLAAILNSIAEGVIITDLAGAIKVFNREAMKLLGNERLEEGSGGEFNHWVRLFYPDKTTLIPLSEYPGQKALRGEETTNLEVFAVSQAHPEGIFLEVNGRPIRDEWGAIQGALAVVRDISSRRNFEDQLKKTNHRFQHLAHLLNDMVWEWDAETNVTLRHSGRSGFGYPDEPLRNGLEWWKDKIHSEDFQRVTQLFHRVMNGDQETWFEEYRFRKADGSYAYVIDRGNVLTKNEKGKPTQILGAMIDITQRRVIEEKLSQFAAIVESTEDAILSLDLDDRIVSWNQGAEKLFGYSAAEVMGHTPDVFLKGRHAELKAQAQDKLDLGESVLRSEAYISKKNGETILCSSTVSPLRNEKNEISGTCVIARDITDLRSAEQRVKDLAERLKRSNEDLTQFAYLASHDLQEPLRTISSFIRLLDLENRDSFNAESRGHMNFVVDSVSRMKRLIESLLEYSRVEQTHLRMESVDCQRLVERLQEDLRTTIDESEAEIILNPLPVIEGDEIQLGQLFQNLISNALKFRSQKRPHILVRAEEKEKNWIFAVQDNGIGIESRFKDQIFQIFRRLNGSRDYAGSGIGLATCKKIVERHGGTIWVDSSPGEGSTFYFSVPRNPERCPSTFRPKR